MPLPEDLYHVVVSVWTVMRKPDTAHPSFARQAAHAETLGGTGSVLQGREQGCGSSGAKRAGIATRRKITFWGVSGKAASFVDIFVVRKDVDISEIVLQYRRRWLQMGDV